MRIFFSLFQYLLLLIIHITRIIIIDSNKTEKYPFNRKLFYSNEVNDLINIYASNKKIGYISSTKNEYGNIYIMINTVESDSSLDFYILLIPIIQ